MGSLPFAAKLRGGGDRADGMEAQEGGAIPAASSAVPSAEEAMEEAVGSELQSGDIVYFRAGAGTALLDVEPGDGLAEARGTHFQNAFRIERVFKDEEGSP